MSLTRAQVDNWLKDLRGGEYVQGRDTLKKYGKYCCLGVLCEGTLGVNLDKARPWQADWTGISIAPKQLKDALNFDVRCRLAEFNDDDRLSFDAIADRIENMIENNLIEVTE